MHLHGPRLTLRPLAPSDAEAVFALNGDPAVMRHFAAPMTREESDAWVARLIAHQRDRGYSFGAVELPGAGCIGVVGLLEIPWQAPFTPAVEIGWRIAPAYQRQGFAEEAARLALAHGFGRLGLERIVAFTPPVNEPSWRLMERLGMRRQGEFDHPRLPKDHRLRRHLWYRVTRPDWLAVRGLAEGGAQGTD
ncbi:GNAT family N-acetyltransferase [Falsiroseomonas tokyonensis]|uniref:GNAT family N-acetyltransferase n=1 Tax=Falsiroseomonas tokyonensis TaxID=430521 RepID=A0ABV7C3A0_9PROT|nr:GNAT family N-acetyltransferase [Falsiroseomonas tokyonensis]MBU8541120.1 GNAT family N-acetyltransferase [Falsiroseomonas tokyonensis]